MIFCVLQVQLCTCCSVTLTKLALTLIVVEIDVCTRVMNAWVVIRVLTSIVDTCTIRLNSLTATHCHMLMVSI